MAICNIIDDPHRGEAEWKRISEHMRGSGPVPADGCRLALLGKQRAITVWDTAEDRDRFLVERLAPAYEAAGRSLNEVTRTQFEVEFLVAGDLAGIAQQPAGAGRR
jgi:hypothetical protein